MIVQEDEALEMRSARPCDCKVKKIGSTYFETRNQRVPDESHGRFESDHKYQKRHWKCDHLVLRVVKSRANRGKKTKLKLSSETRESEQWKIKQK